MTIAGWQATPTDMKRHTLPHPLRRWFAERRISAECFAHRVGLKGRAAVYRIINTGTCSPQTAARIEAATGGEVTALEVLYGDPSRWRLVDAPERQALSVELIG